MQTHAQSSQNLLNEREVASLTGLAPATLRNLRSAGRGPGYVRLAGGRTIRYRPSDVESWIAGGVVSTLDQQIAA